MKTTRNLCLTLPTEKLEEIDRVAASEKRSRSNLVAVALDQFLALRGRTTGQGRLSDLERLAAQTIAQASPAPSTAAAQHLAEHRRLCGFPDEGNTSDI